MEIIVVSETQSSEIERRGGLPSEIRDMRIPIQFPLLRQIAGERCKRDDIRRNLTGTLLEQVELTSDFINERLDTSKPPAAWPQEPSQRRLRYPGDPE